MKKITVLVFISIMILFVGCTKKEPSGVGEPWEEVKCEKDTNYILTELKRSQTNVRQPAGVCVFNNQVVVCDRNSHKLSVLDTDMNFMKEVGQLGSAPGEFMEPTGITAFGDNLYILDSGNSRIQILNSEFETIDTIALNPLVHHQGGARYLDIAVDAEGIIYVSSDSVGVADAYVYVIENGKVQHSKQRFRGFLAEHNGEVFAVDSMELFVEGDDEIGSSGRNNIYCMNKTKMEKVTELPNKYTPADLVFTKEGLFSISVLWGEIYRFSYDYVAERSIASFEEAEMDMYITALNDKEFIITNQTENKMYYLHCQENE